MIGPVQLMMIGTDAAEVPAEIRERVNRLRDAGAIGILDVLSVHKERDGTIDIRSVSDPAPEPPHQPGELIGELFEKARAASTLAVRASTGHGYLMCGNAVPDPQEAVPLGSTVLALLLEHRWAIPLRDAVRDTDAYPVSDAWLGREILRDVRLIPEDA